VRGLIAEVRGDSVVPTLYSGQMMTVHTQDRRPAPPGKFHARDGMGLAVKRVESIPGRSLPTVRIKSDNPRYETCERTLNEARINGRVISGFTAF
jgi:phage repressor protein C with HTH and peptisase S24 domain